MLPAIARRHPPGFAVLWFVELWERASFYGNSALLPAYLTTYLGRSEPEALALSGYYVTAVYTLPLIGGYVADKKATSLQATYFGLAVMLLGHLVMGIESISGCIAGLSMIAIGSGFFKPSMQKLVRNLYPSNAKLLRSEAFGIFYIGINAGGLLGPLAVHFVKVRWGYGYAFMAASIGLATGGVILILLKRYVINAIMPELPELYDGSVPPEMKEVVLAPAEERTRILTVLGITIVTALYWAVAYLDRSAIPLYVKNYVPGGADNTELVSIINPAVVFAISPVIMWLSNKFKDQAKLSTKMQLGLGFTIAACLVLGISALKHPSWSGLFAYYLLVTFGELLLSPVATAAVANVAPPRFVTRMLAIALLSSAFGGFLSGTYGKHLWDSLPKGAFFCLAAIMPLLGIGVVRAIRARLDSDSSTS